MLRVHGMAQLPNSPPPSPYLLTFNFGHASLNMIYLLYIFSLTFHQEKQKKIECIKPAHEAAKESNIQMSYIDTWKIARIFTKNQSKKQTSHIRWTLRCNAHYSYYMYFTIRNFASKRKNFYNLSVAITSIQRSSAISNVCTYTLPEPEGKKTYIHWMKWRACYRSSSSSESSSHFPFVRFFRADVSAFVRLLCMKCIHWLPTNVCFCPLLQYHAILTLHLLQHYRLSVCVSFVVTALVYSLCPTFVHYSIFRCFCSTLNFIWPTKLSICVYFCNYTICNSIKGRDKWMKLNWIKRQIERG